MRILVLNVNAYSGSTGKIAYGLYEYLKGNGHAVKVCYRGIKEEKVSNPDFIPLVSKIEFHLSVFLARLTGLESHFSFIATRRLKLLVKNFKPDLIQLYNIHGNYIRSYAFLEYLKKRGIPVVYSMLDEFPYMGKCPYPRDCEKFKTRCVQCPQKKAYPESWFVDSSTYLFDRKKRIYSGFQNLVFTGPPFVCKRAKESYLLRNCEVNELYEPFNVIDHFYPRASSKLREQLGIEVNDKVIICASGTAPRKGGTYFLEVAKRLQGRRDLRFIFIGYNRSDWIFPDNVIVRGFIKDQDVLAEYLSLADAYVCTSIGDTTPSVCLCALGCGTPLIGFEYGGVMDCAPNGFGTYVPIGDIEALTNVVSECKIKTIEDINAIRNYAKERFSPKSIYGMQESLYKELITR